MKTDFRVLLLLACKWMPYIECAEHRDRPRSCTQLGSTPPRTWVRDNNELGRGAFGIVWREECAGSPSVRAVKVISKQHPRLTPTRWTQEIATFTALKGVSSHSSMYIIPTTYYSYGSTLGTSSSFWNHSKMSTSSLLLWSSFSTATL